MQEHGHLLSIKEVARRLGVSRAWIHRARKEGRFATELKLGKRVLFTEQSLAEWLDRQRREPAAA